MKYVVQGRHETEKGLHVELWPEGMTGQKLDDAKVKEIIFPPEHRETVDKHFAMHSVHDESEFIEVGGSS